MHFVADQTKTYKADPVSTFILLTSHYTKRLMKHNGMGQKAVD